jgi:membrane protease YdiL (CAAX protease family)
MRLLVRLTASTRVPVPRSRASLVFPLYLMMAVVGVVWSILRGNPNPWRIQHHPDPSPIAGLLLGVGFGLLLVLASRLTVARYGWAVWLEQDFRHRLGPLTPRECWGLAIASSLGEELLFRGALLPTVGLGWSSLIFALMHVGQFPRYLPWTVSALIAGLGFGVIFDWSGDLTGPVLAHFLVNYLNLRHLGHRE